MDFHVKNFLTNFFWEKIQLILRPSASSHNTTQYSGKFQMLLAQPRLDLKLSAPDFMLLHLASHGCRPDDITGRHEFWESITDITRKQVLEKSFLCQTD